MENCILLNKIHTIYTHIFNSFLELVCIAVDKEYTGGKAFTVYQQNIFIVLLRQYMQSVLNKSK